MDTYRTETSENLPLRVNQLRDGRKIKKVVDKSFLREPSQNGIAKDIRNYVQLLFFLITLWIELDFYLFVTGLENGIIIQRPPGVEGFLPIDALMSLRYFIMTGIVNNIHPSGFFIFIAAISVSTLLKKGFCSWICPIGYISESLYQLRMSVIKKKLQIPRRLDTALRSLKYLLLSFFMVVVSAMSVVELEAFMHSDYNKVADIKMYMFFANITTFSLCVIGILIVLSLIYENFWCRYACPYGALMGIMSLFSPLKIRRIEQTCIDCGKCARACPSLLPVDKLDVVNSAECTACYNCVDSCPIKNTLKFSFSSKSKGLTPKEYVVLLLGIYFGIVGIAMLVGLWQNSISGEEYIRLFQGIGGIVHPF